MWKWLLNELGRGGDRGAGARENRGREAGAEVKKVIQSLLFITGYYSVKNTYLLKFPFNIHQCLKENFGSKKT